MTDPGIDASPLVMVLTGPSGVGKDALIHHLRDRGYPIVRPATMTTRSPRPGEVDGEHHEFVSRDEFVRHLEEGDLLEHAEVYGNLYGVPRQAVRRALETGRHVVIRVDVQGAETLHGALPGALFVSLEPPDKEVLRHRLEGRASESADEMERRLAAARDEIERARRFCLPVTNVEGDLDATADAIVALIEHERTRPGRAPVEV